MRDHLEAVDHADAFDCVRALADRQEAFGETDLRAVHRLARTRSAPDHAGRYRDVPVFIRGSRHVPPERFAVPGMVDDLFADLREGRLDEHPVAEAAVFHARVEAIRPLVDGNGRASGVAISIGNLRAA